MLTSSKNLSCVLTIGFAFLLSFSILITGIFAVVKSMELKFCVPFNPSIFCELYVKQAGESEYSKVFDNNENPCIHGDLVLDGNVLTFPTSLVGGLGSSFDFKMVNHSPEKVLIDVDYTGLIGTKNAVAEGAVDSTYPFAEITGITTISSEQFTITFKKVYEISHTLTGIEIDSTASTNTLVKVGTKYYVPIGADLVATYKLASNIWTFPYTTNTHTTNGENVGTFDTNTNTLTIPAEDISENTQISLTVAKVKYTITFDKQGGTNAGTSTMQVEHGQNPTTITEPTKLGYRFGGYYTQPNGGGTCYYSAPATASQRIFYYNFATSGVGNWKGCHAPTVSYVSGNYVQVIHTDGVFSSGIYYRVPSFYYYNSNEKFIITVNIKAVDSNGVLPSVFMEGMVNGEENDIVIGLPQQTISVFEIKSVEYQYIMNLTDHYIDTITLYGGTAGSGFQVKEIDFREQQDIPLNQSWNVTANTTLYANWIAY